MNTTRSSYGRRAGGYGKPEGLVVTIPQPSSEFLHKGKWHERRKKEDDVMKTLSCVIDIVQFVYKIHRRTRLCGNSRGRPTQEIRKQSPVPESIGQASDSWLRRS